MASKSPRSARKPTYPHNALIRVSLSAGLCALAACGTVAPAPPGPTSAPPQAGRQVRPGAAARAAVHRARRLLGPVSASFVSASTGWLLGIRPCRKRTCSTLQMRKTTDGGRRWLAVPAPPAPAWSTPRSPAGSVSQVAFADAADGWAFGPGLWATHDGGASWHRVGTHGLAVTSLAASDGRAVATFSRCGRQSRCDRFAVYAAAITADNWRPVRGAAGRGFATVITSGKTGYLSVGPRGAFGRPALLAGPASGAARWRRRPVPCRQVWGLDGLALGASRRGTLVLGCASQPGAGQQPKRAYLSADGGRTWRRLAAPPSSGYLGQVTVTPAGTIMISGTRSDVYISRDGGRSWHTSRSLLTADIGDGLTATMITNRAGFVLQDSLYYGQMWLTHDDGRSWKPITIR